MRTEISYIFIYKEKIYKYKQRLNVHHFLSRYDTYMYLDKIAYGGINMFMREMQLENEFKLDFIVYLFCVPYVVYAERKINSDGSYCFNVIPIIKLLESNKFIYNDVAVVNTYRGNHLNIEDEIVNFKIIDDGVNKFDETHVNILDTLTLSIENIFLLYNVKLPINNIPFSAKNIYVYENTNIDLIKVPFGCNVNVITLS